MQRREIIQRNSAETARMNAIGARELIQGPESIAKTGTTNKLPRKLKEQPRDTPSLAPVALGQGGPK